MLDSISLELSDRSVAPPVPAEAASLFAAIADPLRVGILRHLDARGQQCACDIGETFGVAQNLLSYHLKILREAGLVESERRGRWVHYRIAPDAGAALTAALPIGGLHHD